MEAVGEVEDVEVAETVEEVAANVTICPNLFYSNPLTVIFILTNV